jgi:hypothetical protein
MGHLADPLRVPIIRDDRISRLILPDNPGRNSFHAMGRERQRVKSLLAADRIGVGDFIPRVAQIARAKRRGAGGHARRQLIKRAKTFLILVVIALDNDRLIAELRLKVEAALCSAVPQQGAHDGIPVRAVGMDAPNAPVNAFVQRLRFERAEQ